MAKQQHLKILKQGVESWNNWRVEHPQIRPDLSGAGITEARLSQVNLDRANLSGAILNSARLLGASLAGADLREAQLSLADLREASLKKANLRAANLSRGNATGADFSRAELTGSDLRGANLQNTSLFLANLSRAELDLADFTGARIGLTNFGNVDLSAVIGLETVEHAAPSTIGIDTLYRSQGKIPEFFLRGCGVPDGMIEFARLLTGTAIEFNSCFISYSTKDEEFAKRLYNDLQANGVRCWFAPHDMKGGKKLHEQIDWAIHYHDRVLLLLSPESINSEWVKREIDKALKKEVQENRDVLFPISLVKYKELQTWEYLDSDTGKDIAKEIRSFFIPDFSNWKDHDSYKEAFKKLLQDLKGERSNAESAPDRLPFGVFSANY